MLSIILPVKKVLETIRCHRSVLFLGNVSETANAEQTERSSGISKECAHYSEVDVNICVVPRW